MGAEAGEVYVPLVQGVDTAVRSAAFHARYSYISFVIEKYVLLFNRSLVLKRARKAVQRSDDLDTGVKRTSIPTLQHAVYSLDFPTLRSALSSIATRAQPSANFWATPLTLTSGANNVFVFANECFFLSGQKLLAYSHAHHTVSVARALASVDADQRPLGVNRLQYGLKANAFLVQCEVAHSGELHGAYAIVTQDKGVDKELHVHNARDACFAGADDLLHVLASDGQSLAVLDPPYTQLYKAKTFFLAQPAAAIYATPIRGGSVLLILDAKNCLHYAAFNLGDATARRMKIEFPKSAFTHQLEKDEQIVQMQWLHQPGETKEATPLIVCALVTTRHVYLLRYASVRGRRDCRVSFPLRSDLSQLAVYTVPPDSLDRPHVTSCLWLGYALLFTTNRRLMYLTLKGLVYPLVQLVHPTSVLMSVLCDRVVLAYSIQQETHVHAQAVGLLEPLLLGAIHASTLFERFPGRLDQYLHNVTRCYDATRFSMALVDELDHAGYSSLVLALLHHNRGLTQAHPWLALCLSLPLSSPQASVLLGVALPTVSHGLRVARELPH